MSDLENAESNPQKLQMDRLDRDLERIRQQKAEREEIADLKKYLEK